MAAPSLDGLAGIDNRTILILAALAVGMILGAVIQYSLGVRVELTTTTLSLTKTSIVTLWETVTKTDTRVVVSTTTTTLTETVKVPVTVTATETREVTHTVTQTVTTVETKTATVTLTKTVTAPPTTVTIVLTPETLSGGVQAMLTGGPRGWWGPPSVDVSKLTLAARGGRAEIYTSSTLLAIVNLDPPKRHHPVYAVETRDGRKVLLLSTGPGASGATPVLESIVASYNASVHVAVWDLSKMRALLGSGEYTLVIYHNDVFTYCSFSVGDAGVYFEENCREGVLLGSQPGLLPGYGSYGTILHALAEGVTSGTLVRVAEAVWGGSVPGDPAEAAWSLLAWIEKHISYDRGKLSYIASGYTVGVQGPLETLARRRGVCSDYAVFAAAALKASGLPAMVIVLPSSNHAAAATVIDDTVFVLDQRLPVMELADYMQYIAARGDTVYIYLIRETGREGSLVTLYRLKARAADRFPADMLPADVWPRVVERAAEMLGMTANDQLKTIMTIGHARIQLWLPKLEEVAVTPAPLDAAYSPVFKEQWIELLAGHVASLVEKYFGKSVGRGSLWAEYGHVADSLLIKVVAVPLRFNVEFKVRPDGRLVIDITSTSIGDPMRDVKILIYGSSFDAPCAGVAPRGYYYEDIPYRNAETWTGSAGYARIVIAIDDLRELAAECGVLARLAVIIDGTIVYMMEIP